MISDILTYASKWHGDQEVVTRDGQGGLHRYSYRDAELRARRLARALLALGIETGDRLATLAMNTYRHFELFYGVSGIGAVLHTVNPKLYDEQVTYIMSHAEDKVLFLDPEFVPLWERIHPNVPSVTRVIVLADESDSGAYESYETFIANSPPLTAWPTFDEKTASSLCYTSGTTGNPKGVLYSHRSTLLHAMAAAQNSAMGLSCNDIMLPLTPMFHANAWSSPYLAPMVGAGLVLPGPRLDGPSICSLIFQERVTFSIAVPTVFTMMLEHLDLRGERLQTMKRCVIGGAAVPQAMIERLREVHDCRVLQVWGMTETSPLGTMCTPTPKVLAMDSGDRDAQMRTAGRVQFGMELKLTDSGGATCPHDGQTPGALWVRGPWAASSYFKGEGGVILDQDGWFPTGDVATIDELGYLRITDRSKDVIKSGGEWISSVAVENVVYSHPEVKLAAVIGVPHPKWDERPALFVVRKPNGSVTAEELRDYLSTRMAKWWLPDHIDFVEELPMTATGKIRKATIRESWQSRSSETL